MNKKLIDRTAARAGMDADPVGQPRCWLSFSIFHKQHPNQHYLTAINALLVYSAFIWDVASGVDLDCGTSPFSTPPLSGIALCKTAIPSGLCGFRGSVMKENSMQKAFTARIVRLGTVLAASVALAIAAQAQASSQTQGGMMGATEMQPGAGLRLARHP